MTTSFAPGPDWTTSNRYMIVTGSDLLISNTGGHDVRWCRTEDDQTPTIAPAMSHLIRPGQNLEVRAKSGDRIWLSADPIGLALVEPLT